MDRIAGADGLSHEIDDLRYRHGRHELSLMPGFCGRPAIVLGAKSPDTVSFDCPGPLNPGAVYTLILASGHRLEILITSRDGVRFHATVVG